MSSGDAGTIFKAAGDDVRAEEEVEVEGEGKMVECPKEEKVAHGSEKEEGKEGITLFNNGTGFETSRARFSMVDVSETEVVSNNCRAFFSNILLSSLTLW